MSITRVILATLALWFAVIPTLPALAKKSNDPRVEQWSYEDTGVYRAWDISTGSSDVVVAIIDNGFDSGHPDLRQNVWINTREIAQNGMDDDKNGYIDDTQGWNFALEDTDNDGQIAGEERKGNNNPRPSVEGLSEDELEDNVFSHGTVVAGIIGAVGNNERDGSGINWKIKLMNIKVLGNSGIGFLDKMPEAIHYAVDNGADIINISIVGDTKMEDLDAALKYAYDKGVFVAVASGNDYLDLNSSRMYPVCSDVNSDVGFVIGTSAIDEDHHSAFFSNTGSDCVDIAAPGVSINSTIRYSPKNGLDDSYGYGWDGTSFAAPFVSGGAALLKSVRPDWKAPQIADAFLRSVQHTPSDDEEEYANLFGAGLIQIDKALAYAVSTKKEEIKQSNDGKHIVLSYRPDTGDVEERKVLTGDSSHYKRIGLVGIDKLVSFKDEAGNPLYAVARRVTDGGREVVVYNRKFAIQNRISIPEKNPIDIVVGDVDARNAGLEIIVSSQVSSAKLFKVYKMNGALLHEVDDDDYRIFGKKNNGVRLALARTNSGVSSVLALHDTNDARVTKVAFGDSVAISSILLPGYAKGGSIAAGDIDADGADEFIIGSGKGQQTALGYYEMEGTLKSKFFGYDPGFTGGIRAQILDYDADGAEDVLISAFDGSQPVRVWNRQVKRLDNWYPFGADFRGIFLTVSSF